MSAGWDRTPGVSSLSATELSGKLTTEEWAPWEQDTINSAIWVLLPITTPFRRRSDFLVVGVFEFIALFAVCWSKGKIHRRHSLAMLKGHLSHQILCFHSTLSTWNFSNGYLIIPAVGRSSLLCMKHLFWWSSKVSVVTANERFGECISNNSQVFISIVSTPTLKQLWNMHTHFKNVGPQGLFWRSSSTDLYDWHWGRRIPFQ